MALGSLIISRLSRRFWGWDGTVFKAKDRLGRLWAIKILREDRLSEDMCKRFFIEAQQMQSLKHENLLEIQDYRIFEGGLFSFSTVQRKFL